jgi:hypothetical protein
MGGQPGTALSRCVKHGFRLIIRRRPTQHLAELYFRRIPDSASPRRGVMWRVMELGTNLCQIVAASTRAAPNPDVTIVYEDFSTGLSAKELFDHLLNPNRQASTYCLTMWKFNLLRVRPLRAQAVQDAATSGILCLAARADCDLPGEVTDLVSESLRQRRLSPTALVILLEAGQPESAARLPAIKSLKKIADQAGAQFFLNCLEPRSSAYEFSRDK